MDNIDDAETNAKISDSAYSNSCSNSQSRRSHSSKSTHSGSNSSGSSGYGGKASTSGSSNALGQPPKKDKESKKKKLSQAEAKAAEATPEDEQLRTPEPAHILASPKEESDNVDESNMDVEMPEKVSVNMDILPLETANNDEEALALQPVGNAESFVTSQPPPTNSADGFSCVISMHDGVVTYASASITETLGYPREIWTGRSFINMVHPKDHKTFSSLITNGMAFPKLENGKTEKGQTFIPGSTMVCRLRRYRNLNGAFGIKNYIVMYAPFLLKFYFKDHSDHDVNIVYLILQATHYFSAFKTPNELVPKPVSFVIKHGPDGVLEYIDPESAPYMGYLPQDIQDKNALHLYHPDDLPYLRYIYESIVREGKVSSSRPYRLMTQNGDYIKVETEWSSVVNPWSMKLEFVIAKHHILEGPTNPDVFQSPGLGKSYRMSEAENYKIQAFRDTIINVMKEVRTRSAEVAKGKRCQDLDSFMENLIEETPKQDDDLRMELQDRDHSCFERDSVMLGGISPHHDSDSKSSIETPLSYNQLNYNENLQRYFDSQEPLGLENVPPTEGCIESRLAHVPYPSSRSQSPMALNSQDNDMSSNSSAMAIYVSSPGPPADYQIAEHAEFQLHKLSKNALDKHNSKMEKELVKMHRESRSSKGDREKASNETRKKKKEHFARCNATFHPTSAGDESTERKHRISAKGKQQGVKRPSKPQITDTHAQKHHCSSPRERRRPHVTRTPPPAQPSVPSTTTTATTNWQSTQNVNHFNMFGVGIPQQMPMLNHMPTMPVASSTNCPKTLPTYTNRVPPMQGASVPSSRCPPASVPIPGVARYPTVSRYPTVPMPPTAYPRSNIYPGQAAMPGMPCTSGVPPMSAAYGCHMPGPSAMPSAPVMPSMYPVYYSPVTNTTPSTSKQQPFPSTSAYQPYQPQMPYVVHGHPISMVYGQPFMYSPVNPQMYPMPQNYVTEQLMHQCTSSINSLPLSDCNIDQANKPRMDLPPLPPRKQSTPCRVKRVKRTLSERTAASRWYQYRAYRLRRTAELVQSSSSNSMCGNSQKARTSDDNTDRTDGESSYSSFYSSFFKTDSGSAEDSGDQFNKPNDVKNRFWTKAMPGDDDPSFQGTKRPVKKFARKKMDAPWNEEVNLTSELIYKYQLRTKPVHEVLEADKQKLKSMAQQSPMVNEQLGQLYLDLQLQGVAARLTLEEGITSSSSSGEEPMPMPMSCKTKRKHEFSKLVIIHEENAPLPTPDSGLLIPESEIETTPSRKTS